MVSLVFGNTQNFKKADSLDNAKQFQEELALLQSIEETQQDNPQYLWRAARVYFNLGDQNAGDEKLQKKYFYPGFEHAEKCVAKAPELAEGHQYYAILVGKIGELEGTKQKIKNSYKVKEHALQAIELDPDNDSNYHVMGRWHFTLSELSWIEKKVAEMIYSELPEASFKEASVYFQKAHAINPEDLRHILWLGKSLYELGQTNAAEKTWKQALPIQPKSDSEKVIKQKIKKALN